MFTVDAMSPKFGHVVSIYRKTSEKLGANHLMVQGPLDVVLRWNGRLMGR